MKLRWRFGIIAGLFLAVFSLYPQFKMLYLRGGDWNGHYAYNDVDEVAYASYLKALIDGRPRKNDPYTGRDDSPQAPQSESLFSSQFAGPYTIAIPARVFGVSAPWAMTISGAATAFLTAVAIFWLMGMITGDSLFAMAASLVTLAGGALFAGEGAIGEILGTGYSYPYFPGFRRYIPAMAFPAFFVFVALVWRLTSKRDDDGEQSGPLVLIAFGAIAFAYTVFSYFYVWTTATAWLGCVGLLWFIFRPEGAERDIKKLAALAAVCVAVLLPYGYLLSQRSHTMDEVQMLVRTHALDLTRTPELICFAVIIVITAGVFFGVLKLRDRGTLFAASLALAVIVVFNQQVITGQSLQPIHYQVFIGNYVAGLAVMVTLALFWRQIPSTNTLPAKLTITALALLAVGWGFVECHYTVRILDDVNVVRDESLPVARRLTELASGDPSAHQRVVLHMGIAEADDLPTVAPQSVLWARHQHVFAGVTWQENKERYYQQLYYQGVDPRQLAAGIKDGGDFVSMIALFGWGRHTDRLNSEYKPLTFGEIDAEATIFFEYARTFNPKSPGVVQLDYLVALGDSAAGFENIDKWYTRDAGEQYGNYTLYKLTRR
ncbi:MAG: hypothetical protein ABIV21_02760 [Pyrinomonadaceae bacterium]